jgi:hypothetical protein
VRKPSTILATLSGFCLLAGTATAVYHQYAGGSEVDRIRGFSAGILWLLCGATFFLAYWRCQVPPQTRLSWACTVVGFALSVVGLILSVLEIDEWAILKEGINRVWKTGTVVLSAAIFLDRQAEKNKSRKKSAGLCN